MDPHALVSPFQAKVVEYLIAVAYLVLFVPFWRYLSGPRGPAARAARVSRPATRTVTEGGWFAVPDGVSFHPGHAWLQANGDAVVTVGADEFAFELVAPTRVSLPAPGEELRQGEPGWLFGADGHDVAMLSPVSGTVVEVNAAAASGPEKAAGDPFGRGWLMKVRAPRLAIDRKQLLEGPLARKWMEGVAAALRAGTARPGVLALEDGGAPVHGIAQALDGREWPALARTFLLS